MEANTNTGRARLRMLTPQDRIAVTSLSADKRPKLIKTASNAAMGIEKVKIVGKI